MYYTLIHALSRGIRIYDGSMQSSQSWTLFGMLELQEIQDRIPNEWAAAVASHFH